MQVQARQLFHGLHCCCDQHVRILKSRAAAQSCAPPSSKSWAVSSAMSMAMVGLSTVAACRNPRCHATWYGSCDHIRQGMRIRACSLCASNRSSRPRGTPDTTYQTTGLTVMQTAARIVRQAC